jgi:O-acetyl-ADP-ribose deacetylase (regulator of RNase III)
MPVEVIDGDIFKQDVDAIVNPWNRNFIPWWLLLPQGVSGQLKKLGGTQPFKEVGKQGLLKVGQAVRTSAGRLPFRHVIHVAALEWYWRASERSVRISAANAVDLAIELNVESIAFPLLGTGTGGMRQNKSIDLISGACSDYAPDLQVLVVRYSKPRGGEA